MRYLIQHTTVYTYDKPVSPNPHLIRLRPRSDGWQKLHDFQCLITPEPTGISEIIDLDGNALLRVWFKQETEQLKIEINSNVETFKTNPFDFLYEPWALSMPLDYPSSLAKQLQSYLTPYNIAPDPISIQLAQEILHEVNNSTGDFLFTLMDRIYRNCEQVVRHSEDIWSPSITWTKKQGACRDLVVLFMDVCRSVGLATRFVSGYQEGDSDTEEFDLHAWVEVYLPGGGWRSYDPTHGLLVSDRHIALVSSAIPCYASPIVGSVTPVAQSNLQAHIKIRKIS
ncbi:transglutaminase family protein [Chroococcus sp. FPU101]|uniref:transglutaminase family protein n=1 Tax=Chroococcus sp. FPU101 TaxID=1974212 RepID=UPI001A8D2B41|nr:transglutaminase family protein [Chroococcus sp. FPU101]GFE70317.1 transglutaminase domain protein [Chroococcus sp. FPU101]